MRIIVAVVAVACASRLAAAQSTQMIEARLRELIAVASRGDSAAFLAFDRELPADIARIHAAHPRYEWAQLDQAARAKRLTELSASNTGESGMGSLITWTAFPYRIVDIEPRLDNALMSGGASSFVTFDYSDPQHAPIYYQTVVRRVVLKVETDRNMQFVSSAVLKTEGFQTLAPRIVSARWTYSRNMLFRVGFVGGILPVSASLQCGQQAAVTRRGLRYSDGASLVVPQVDFDRVRVDQPSTCFVAIEDANGKKDAVRFDTPALSMSEESRSCWPRPEFKELGLVLRFLECGPVTGTLADAKEFGVGAAPSAARGTLTNDGHESVTGTSARAPHVGDAYALARLMRTQADSAAFDPGVDREIAGSPVRVFEVVRSSFANDKFQLLQSDEQTLVIVAEKTDEGRFAGTKQKFFVSIDADSLTATTSRLHLQAFVYVNALGGSWMPSRRVARRSALQAVDNLQSAVSKPEPPSK
ncbi:MAG TPA: hypothetical protein VGJ96_07855 [Gemmatimonadaceae bacterium]|jgi:hypothetical protein